MLHAAFVPRALLPGTAAAAAAASSLDRRRRIDAPPVEAVGCDRRHRRATRRRRRRRFPCNVRRLRAADHTAARTCRNKQRWRQQRRRRRWRRRDEAHPLGRSRRSASLISAAGVTFAAYLRAPQMGYGTEPKRHSPPEYWTTGMPCGLEPIDYPEYPRVPLLTATSPSCRCRPRRRRRTASGRPAPTPAQRSRHCARLRRSRSDSMVTPVGHSRARMRAAEEWKMGGVDDIARLE